MDFKEFLKSKRELLGYSQNKFSKLVGITQSYFNSIERGEVKNPPSEEVLENIISVLQLDSKDRERLLYLAAIQRTPLIILDKLKKLNKDLKSKHNQDSPNNSIPLFERISAGLGTFADEAISDYIVLPGLKNIENVFAVNVKGDSMEPTIKDGSIIICKKDVEIRNGEIGAFFVDDEAFVKRIKLTSEYIALMSDNPNYPPIYIGPKENFKAIGKVIKVLSDVI